jgi:hypothetical protein
VVLEHGRGSVSSQQKGADRELGRDFVERIVVYEVHGQVDRGFIALFA